MNNIVDKKHLFNNYIYTCIISPQFHRKPFYQFIEFKIP